MQAGRFPRRSIKLFSLLSLSGLLLLAACFPAPAEDSGDDGATFRVRADFAAGLNDDLGWAGASGEIVTVDADRPFRVRFEVERAAGASDRSTFRLQARRNGGEWSDVEAHDFPKPEREQEVELGDVVGGELPVGWAVGGRDASGSEIMLYTAPWPVTELALELRRPAGDTAGLAIVFGWVDRENHWRVGFDPAEGTLGVSRVVEGEETVLAKESFEIPAGEWVELEIELAADRGEMEIGLADGALEATKLTPPLGDEMPAGQVGFRLPERGGVQLRRLTVVGEARTPRISIVSTAAYSDGAPTVDLLNGSSLHFEPGAGVDLAGQTPTWKAEGAHGEFEWPLVIRRWADGAVTNEEGDLFELRMVDPDGGAVSPTATIRLGVSPGHVGGTFVETPGRVGPWQAANGDLYFVMEPAETDNVFMMVKSSDSGRTWREVDAGNRPRTDDLEAVDGRLVGDTIHLVHQVTSSTRYHSFRTSDHPNRPDTWAVRDEVVAEVDSLAQGASLVVRSDGSMVAFYVGDTVRSSVRSADGGWSASTVLDPDAAATTAGPQAALGADDIVHVAYYGLDGTVWYRRLQPDGTLSARQQLASGLSTTYADFGSVLPLVFDPSTSTVVVLYRQADGRLRERRIGPDGAPTPEVTVTDRPVLRQAVDSQQPEADAVLDGETVRVLFVDAASRSLFSTHDRGGWQPSELEVAGIRGSWIRGSVYVRPDGVKVYGYVYDAGSEGGAGMNRFGELVLAE